MKTNKIKNIKIDKQQIPVTKFNNSDNDTPIFVFNNFCYESIEIDEFNNKYMNQKESIATVNAFIERIKNLENTKLSEALRQSHFHSINSEIEVKRIEKVLRKGYKINENKIKSFENTYFEIGFGDGQRIICSRVENYFDLLFIDSNHMIYKGSSRFLKAKEKYKYPSCFEKIDFGKTYLEFELIEMTKMIIDDYESGKIEDSEEIIDNLKYLIGGDDFPPLPSDYNEKKDTQSVV